MRTAINIDYLIFNLENKTGKELIQIIPNNFGVIEKEYGTAIFSRAFEIFYENNLIFYVWTNPHSDIIDKDFIQVQVTNRFLYQPLQWQKGVVNEFLVNTGLTFKGLNRLDIAIDSNIDYFLHNDAMKFETMVENGFWLLSGRKAELNTYRKVIDGKIIKSGFTYGIRGQQRYFRLYNKTLEMSTKFKKHIYDFWTKNGLDTTGIIYRSEFELRQKFLKTIDSLDMLFNRKFQLEVFKAAAHNFINPRINQGKKRIADNQEVNFFNWEFVKVSGKGEYSKPKRVEPIEENQDINYLKQSIRVFFRMYYEQKQENILPLFHISQILKNESQIEKNIYQDSSLIGYFYSKVHVWNKILSNKYGFSVNQFDFEQMAIDMHEAKSLSL